METEVDTRLLEAGQDPASITAVPGAPTIAFRHVHFAYEADEDVLHDIDFAVVPGEKVALVGESGGGKSTIVNLLLGLYEAREGQVQAEQQGPGREPAAGAVRDALGRGTARAAE